MHQKTTTVDYLIFFSLPVEQTRTGRFWNVNKTRSFNLSLRDLGKLYETCQVHENVLLNERKLDSNIGNINTKKIENKKNTFHELHSRMYSNPPLWNLKNKNLFPNYQNKIQTEC